MSTKELKLNWDLTCFYNSDTDPKIEKDLDYVVKKANDFFDKWENTKDYLSNPVILKQALDDYEKLVSIDSLYSSLFGYFYLRKSQDQGNTIIKALDNKINSASIKITNFTEFFTNRLSKVSADKQKAFLESSELVSYKHFLEKLFESSKYILSEPEEKILSATYKTSHKNWVTMVSTFLAKEELVALNEEGMEVPQNLSTLIGNISSTDKTVRDSCAKAVNTLFIKYLDVAEQEINSILENEKNVHEIKKIERPDKARHIEDDIDSGVVDALIEGVSSRNDISSRFYSLKSKLLKLPKLQYHERNVPIGSSDKKYTYDQSVDIVRDVFGNLDKDFLRIYDEMLLEGRFDVMPYKGKDSGAYCLSLINSTPVFVLLNFTNKLGDICTIAHEMGHAINDYLMKVQNNLNYGVPLCIAEVSSTFMEDFVLEKLMHDVDDETKLSLIMEKLNDDVSTIFRQVACYKFEQDLHKTFREKSYLSSKEIGEIFTKHMSSYMGEFVEQSEGSENWWVYWSHIRRFFYVYSYASGLIISKYMQRKYREDNKFIEKVKEFLAAGSSKSPKDIFLDLGIDISDKNFWIEGVKETEDLLNEAETLAKKLGKI